MPIFLLSIILQALAIAHVLRTGRNMWWIFLILFVPGVGVLVYFIVEVLPSLNQSPTARRAARRMREAVDPNRSLRDAQLDYERNRSVDTASSLADALSEAGRFDEAIDICNRARTGLFESDPKILMALARAQFGAKRYTDTIATLDVLREGDPPLRSPDSHLLYARALEESGATERALAEYESVVRHFPGVEARVRQALLYKKVGKVERAREIFARILDDARVAPKHFRRSQQEWIALSMRESANLPGGR